VIEPIEFWTKEMAQQYLPPFKPLQRLHPDKVVSMGAFGMPEIYAEQRYAHEQAVLRSRPIIDQAWDELAKLTGRKYSAVELYKADDADTLILAMGSTCGTASLAVDKMREQGKKVGLVKLRLWRPLPVFELRQALSRAKDVMVIDRAVTPGAGNSPVAGEMRGIMYHEPQRPTIHSVVAGLGGRDVTPDDVVAMVENALSGAMGDYQFYGVRG
jgi:pyruvate ferredoxin oxidoreductase alpha subunit